MINVEISRTQKILLITIFGGFFLLLLINFVLIKPYNELKLIKKENLLTDAKIEKHARKISYLQKMKREYHRDEKNLGEVKSELFVDGVELLNVLTKNSPVKNFQSSTLGKSQTKKNQAGIVEYPFSLKFKNSYKKLGEYLHYQENSLPISFVESIKILKNDNKNSIETTLSGIIYTVTN